MITERVSTLIEVIFFFNSSNTLQQYLKCILIRSNRLLHIPYYVEAHSPIASVLPPFCIPVSRMQIHVCTRIFPVSMLTCWRARASDYLFGWHTPRDIRRKCMYVHGSTFTSSSGERRPLVKYTDDSWYVKRRRYRKK